MERTERERAIWYLVDLFRGNAWQRLSVDQQLEAAKTIKDHQIERYAYPSAEPGVSGNPGVSPKQQAIREAFLSGQYRFIAASGANQSGKTQAIGGVFCEHLRDRAKNGDVYWVIAQTSETSRDIPAKTLWEMLPAAMFPKNVNYHPRLGFGQVPTIELILPEGRGRCELWFKSEEQGTYKFESSRLSGVWWTECQREILYDLLQPRLIKFNGFMLMDFVPLEGWHLYRIKVPAETGDPDLFHLRFGTADNGHNLPPGSIASMRRRMTAEQAAIRIDGKDGAVFGAVYPQFNAARHVVEPFQIPEGFPRWRCYDYGFRNPCALLWAAMLPAKYVVPADAGEVWGGKRLDHEVLCVYREYYEKGHTVARQAQEIKERSAGEEYVGDVIADPSIWNILPGYQAETIASLFSGLGLEMQPGVRANVVDETAMVNAVRLWFEADKIWFFRTCNNSIREHQVWKHKASKDGEVAQKEPFEDRNNHACDSLKEMISEAPTFAQPVAKSIDTADDLFDSQEFQEGGPEWAA